MCGRYVLMNKAKKLADFYRISFSQAMELALQTPRFNIAPTQDAPLFRLNPETKAPELASLKWGLVPAWSKSPKPGYSTINAQAETADTKPAFRAAFKKRRCVVPMDGFYEWRRNDDDTKTPHFIRRADGEPMGVAGLWEHWEGDGEIVESFTLLTTEANGFMQTLHHRMPCFLVPEDFRAWIDEGPKELLRPCPDDWLTAYPVSTRVNNARNQGPENIEPAGAPAEAA